MTARLNLKDYSPGLHGLWTLDVYEGDIEKTPSGLIVNKHLERFVHENLIVTVGKQMIMDRLYGLSAVGPMTRTGVGTSATAAAVGNTTLTGGVFKVFDATPIRSSLTVTSITTFATGEANISWNELALDNGTTILNRIAPIGPFTKTAAVSIIVTVAVTQA